MDILRDKTKLLYLLSALFFLTAGINSILGMAALILSVFVVLKTPNRFKPLSAISLSHYVITSVIMLLMIAFNSSGNYLTTFVYVILSSYFIVQSIGLIELSFNKEKKRKNFGDFEGKLSRKEVLIISITNTVVMTFFTTSSPLYTINYWDDANCYFTLGRSILNGLVPYRDVYEQKGPYIYFFHALAAFIYDRSFIVVFIFEIILAIVFSAFVWKTIRLFYKSSNSIYVLIPLQVVLTYSAFAFYYGDSAEELCFPLLSIVVFYAFKAASKGALPNRIETLVIGLITGVLFFIKYTFCGLIFGYLIYVIVVSCKKKEFKLLLTRVLDFLIGFIVAFLPVLIYFLINGAISNLFEAYFYNNIFLYSGTSSKFNILDNLNYIAVTMARNDNIRLLIVLSLLVVGAMRKEIRHIYLLMFGFLMLTTYGMKNHMFYYCLILVALVAPGYLLLNMLFDKCVLYFKSLNKRASAVPYAVAIVVIAITFALQGNLPYLLQSKDEIPQIVFADIINEQPNAKVLTYDVMDGGFYTYSGALPANKYYCFLNIKDALPELGDSQDQLISEGEFDYIITFTDEYDWDNYEIVSSVTNPRYLRDANGLIQETYFLYKKK